MITYKSKILFNNSVIDGYVSVDHNIITYVGKNKPCDDYIEITEGIITPGFIDIHCHSSLQ